MRDTYHHHHDKWVNSQGCISLALFQKMNIRVQHSFCAVNKLNQIGFQTQKNICRTQKQTNKQTKKNDKQSTMNKN